MSRKRIARLVWAAGLQGVSRWRGHPTTVRRPEARPAPDLVECGFTAEAPDQLWVTDIVYVPTMSGFLYLAIVLDAFSRRVLGWQMAGHLRTELVTRELEMALQQQRGAEAEGVTHHSDQGCQYTLIAFGQRCRRAGVRPSTGSVGDCFGSALCESFFATLECELID